MEQSEGHCAQGHRSSGKGGGTLYLSGEPFLQLQLLVFSGTSVLTCYLSLYNFNRSANKNSNFNKEIVLLVALFTLISGQQLITVL